MMLLTLLDFSLYEVETLFPELYPQAPGLPSEAKEKKHVKSARRSIFS